MNRPSFASAALSFLAAVCIVLSSTEAKAATAATPTFSPGGGTYNSTQSVTISDSTSGATIYYTTDGSTPTTGSTKYQGTAISVSVTTKVQAIATATGFTQSSVGSATYTIVPPGTSGTLQVFISSPGAQSTTVSGVATETFDSLSTGNRTTSYTSTGIGTYAASSSNPFNVAAPDVYGGATDSTHTSHTNYFAVGKESGSTASVTLTLNNPATYFGFWWSAGDANNRVALYSGSTLYGTFSTADLLSFLNNGQGSITASNGTQYSASSYFGNPNYASGSNDGSEPFAYVSFVITGTATINKIVFYNLNTTTGFESDNHSVIFSGGSVVIPSTYAPVETLTLGTQVVTPVLIPNYNVAPMTVAISTSTAGALINYTTDGSAPTTSHGTPYAGPITVGQTETVKAIGFETGLATSSVASTTYTIPTLTVASSGTPSTYGNSVTFTATISSGPTGTITFYDSGTSIGTGTISGGSARLTTSTLAAGSHSITASWLGNSTYGSVLSSAITQTVSQAPLTITASSPTVTYGSSVPTITPSFSGWVNGQSSSSLTTQPTCTTAYTPTSAAGSSPSTSCSGAVDANYAITYVAGRVTVNQAPLTITASSPTVTYGAAVPSITPSYSGWVNGQSSSSLTTQPTCTTAYTPTSAAGSTPSTSCSGAVDANYAITYVAGAVTVSQAPLTITASSPTVTYSSAVPGITPSFSGWVNGQSSSSLTTQPTCTTAYTPTSAAGSTPSTSCSGAVDANYAITYVAGAVTVSQAALTVTGITANNKTYDGTTTATLNTAGASLVGVVSGDTVTLNTSGAVGTFAQASVGNNITVTVTGLTLSGASAANYTLTQPTTTASITTASSFTLAASPASLNIGQGGSSTSTITVTGANGFSGSVNLAASGLPSGVTAAFATNPATATSVLTLTASSSATVGSATITITGTSGSLNASTSIALTVTAQCATNGYGYVRAIDIDHTKVPNTDQINFPFLFSTTDPLLKTAANGGHIASPDGYDIIFTSDPAGKNPLPYEMEEYNPATGQVVAWVQIPNVSHSSDTVIYLFYGNPNITTSQQNPTAVWDSNYKAVYHLPNGSVLSAQDSTSNSINGTLSAGSPPTATTGEIGGGASFMSSSDQYITMGNSLDISTQDFTIEYWLDASNTNQFSPVVAKRNPSNYAQYQSGIGSVNGSGNGVAGKTIYFFGYDSSNLFGYHTTNNVIDGNWHHVAVTRSGSTLLIYVDGNLASTTQDSAGTGGAENLSNTGNFNIGFDNGTSYFNGAADEVRISVGLARSADWIAAGYANQSSPATFYALSGENAIEAVPASVSLLASQSQQFAVPGICSGAVAWSMPNNAPGTLSSSGLYMAPASITQPQTVTITGQTETENLTSATVTLVPQFWPNGGPAGTVVTINGQGFGGGEGSSSVTVGGLPAVTLAWSASQIQVQIPTGTGVGNQNVVVTVGGQTISSTTFNVTAGLTGITPPLNAPAGLSGAVTINTSGQTGPLLFYASQGQIVSLAISNDTFNSWSGSVNLTILNPDGTTVASPSFCTATAFGCALLSQPIALQQTGIYTLQVNPNGATGSTNFTLWLYTNQTSGTITPGTPKTATINIPGQEDLMTFSGSVGQTATVAISNDTLTSWNGSVTISILKPDGTTLPPSSLCDFTFVGCALQTNTLVLPQTGIYTLLVNPGGGTGSVSLLLTETASITIGPTSVTLWGSQVQQFTATVNGDTDSPVYWTLTPATGAGTLSSMGLYTAPASISTQQTVTVTATSVATPTQPVSATVTLIPHEVTVAPSTAVLYSGQAQTFTATCTASCPASMSWSVSPSGLGTLAPNGFTASYTAPANITAQQTVTITATNPIDNTNASAIATLTPPASSPTLSLVAAAPSPYPTGASQAFYAILKNRDGTPLSGGAVTFTVTGANNNSGSGITDSTGTATYTYTGVNSGNDVVHATASIGSEQVTSNSVSAAWVAPTQPISTTTVTGRFFLSNDSVLFNTPVGTQPVFVETFPSLIFNPPSGTIPGLTTVNDGSRPFTNVATDVNGNVTGTIVAQGNGYQAGCGPTTGGSCNPDVLGDMTTFNAVFSGEFTVASAGTVTFTYLYDDSFILGIGNGATPASNSPILNAPAFTTFDQLPTMGSVGLSFNSPTSIAVNFPSPGTYPFEVDYDECCGGPLYMVITASGTGSAGVPATASLTLSPNSVNPQPAGGSQTFTVLATDASGNPVPNANIGLEVTGDDELQLSGTTDSTGHATIVYNDVNPGTAYVQAVAFIDGTVIYSDQVTVTWTSSGGGGTGSGSGLTQGWIGSPANGSGVSGIVPITVAAGETLTSGTLSYYPANNPTNVTVLNSAVNASGGQQIGTLDATALPNGSYWITLQATDHNGNSQYSLSLVTVTGSYKPGRVTTTITDLVVPATGLPIQIQRTYDSLNAGTVGDFGYGWNLGISTNLTVDPKGDVTFTLGGQRKTFYLTPQILGCGLVGCLFPWYSPVFTPEPGLFGTLTDSGAGCTFDMLLADGECVGGGQYTPPGYIYTDPNGTQYTIGAGGQLQSVLDKNGNGLTIGPNGITSTTGLNVPFVRDSQNRITQITDPAGNVYSYGYDANGNLASVTYPPMPGVSTCLGASAPNTSQYSYYPDSIHPDYPAHYYAGGTDGRCNPLPSTTFFPANTLDASGKYSVAGKLASVTDAAGKTTTYTYNLATNTTTVTFPTDPADGNGQTATATMIYDSQGDLLQSTDPLGHTTTNRYDASFNLLSTTDPLGHTTSYTYDANGNKTSITYPNPQLPGITNTTSTTNYNQFSEPVSTTDEDGNTRTFTYDANFNPLAVTDSVGTLMSTQFNAAGQMLSGAIGYDLTQNPARASQFTYDANGNLISKTDALGRTTSYTYNSLGQKVTMTEPVPTGSTAAQATTTYTYDAYGNITETQAPLGRTTYSAYDSNGNKISDTDARGYTTSYVYDNLNRLIETDYPTSPVTKSTKTYDFHGNVVTETDQNGNVTVHQYDLAGRQTSVTQAYGTANATTTSYAYDNAGRKISETDNLGHVTAYTYDNAGNLLSVTKGYGTPSASTTSYAYDNARNRISMADGKGNTTQYAYDARKRLTTTTYPDQSTKTNAYDGPGNLISVTDQAQNVVQYNYDAANQLINVVQTASPNTGHDTTIYGYDANGNPITLEDANTHTTNNLFDVFNELTQKTLPDNQSIETRTYDNNGNLKTVTHFNNVTTTYTYDQLNRLLSRTTPGDATVSFTYTATGKRQTMTDQSGTTTYGYDSMDRLSSKATPEGTLSYTYDAAGNLQTMTSNHAHGVSVTYSYDDLNRLSTVADANLAGVPTNITQYSYDNASNLGSVQYPNGVTTQFTYDLLNRVATASSATGSGQFSSYTYQRNPTGTLKNVVELGGRTVNWTYDGIYRLTNEAITNDPSTNGSLSYTLDPVGNRTSDSSSLSGISSGSWGYNSDDEVATESYDANGNVTATGGKSFLYDSENHLMSMNGGTVSIVYDGDGNRVAKTVNGMTTYYLVDDLNPTGYAQVVEELSGTGVVQRQYTYGLQRIDEEQEINGTWTTSFYGYDGGGNVRQLTNAAGGVTDTYEYDAFGNALQTSGSTPNNYLYRGEQYDSDLGLYYLRARYYNPVTGRFMSRDPEDHPLTDIKELQKYLYAGGDPVDLRDPSGRDLIGKAFLIADIAVTAAKILCYTAAAAFVYWELVTLEDTGHFAKFPIEYPLWFDFGCAVLAGASGP